MRRLRCGHRLQMGTGPTDQLVVVWWMLGLVEVVLLRDMVVCVMVMMVVQVVREG